MQSNFAVGRTVGSDWLAAAADRSVSEQNHGQRQRTVD
jgi:hypothetical protein